MKKLLPYFKPYIKESILGPLFKVIEAIFDLLVPVIVALIVDKGLGESVLSGDKYIYPDANKAFIVKMVGVLIAFAVVGLICTIIAQYFAAKSATGVSSGIRRALFKKLQSLKYSDLDELGTSAMITRMTGDINQFQAGVNLALRLFMRSPFIVFGALIAAFFIDIKISLIFLITIIILFVVVFGIMLKTMPLHKKSQGKLDLVTRSTRENLTGVRVIRAFCLEEEEKQEFASRNRDLTKSRSFADGISALMNPLTYAIINIAVILLIYFGGVRVNSGNLSQGNVIALYNLMSQILIELIKLANLIITVSKAVACGDRIEKVLLTESQLDEREDVKISDKYIDFADVSMQYHKGTDGALENISFSVEKGETVGVIGGTGSGKTTLVNLIPHFYDVSSGAVIVDGKDVRSYDTETLRKKIGVVPQKAVLFKGTIRDNMLWGKKDATDEEIFEALKVAQAYDVVMDKGGLDAVVEQNGKNFSGGQRQRLTIARALVGKPEILILDDSASALDYATDAKLRKAIKELSYKPTLFVVSQRTSAMNGADKIVVLDEGRAVGIGTHDELLRECDVYKEIYSSQFKGEKEAKNNG